MYMQIYICACMFVIHGHSIQCNMRTKFCGLQGDQIDGTYELFTHTEKYTDNSTEISHQQISPKIFSFAAFGGYKTC